MFDAGQARRLLEFGGRVEDGDEALDDHVVELLFGLAEFGELTRRNDGKVIRNLLAVEHTARLVQAWALVGAAFEYRLGVLGDIQITVADVLHRFADVADVVFRQVAGIRPRIGDHLVLFIKRLGDLERAFGGKRCFALERGEVVKLWGDLGIRLLFLADLARFALAAGLDRFGSQLVPDPLGLGKRLGLVFFPSFVDPLAEVFTRLDAESGVDFEVRRRLERLDLSLALGEDRQRRRLHPPCGGDVEAAVAGIETSEGAGRVESDQPVRLGAALGGVGQRLHLLAGAEVFPSFEDGIVGHRLHPQPLDRLVELADFHDVAENQLPFAAGVASVDDQIDVLALGEFEHLLEAGLGSFDRIKLELLRDRWQHGKVPWQLLAVGAHRHAQLNQVADSRGDHCLLVLKKHIAASALLFELAELFGQDSAEVSHDTRFFGNDQCFSHKKVGPLSGAEFRD